MATKEGDDGANASNVLSLTRRSALHVPIGNLPEQLVADSTALARAILVDEHDTTVAGKISQQGLVIEDNEESQCRMRAWEGGQHTHTHTHSTSLGRTYFGGRNVWQRQPLRDGGK